MAQAYQGHLKLVVIHSLKEGSKSGYELMNHIEKISGTKPSPGSIYPLLTKLKKEKIVDVKKKGNKKIYSLTLKGKKAITFTGNQKFFKDIEDHLKLMGSFTGKKVNNMLKAFEGWKKGDPRYYWLMSEMIELKNILSGLVMKITDKKKQDKIKKIILNATKELKKI